MTAALAASLVQVGGCEPGCRTESAITSAPDASLASDGRATNPDAARAPDASGGEPRPGAHSVHPASRCGECHGRLQEEWARSTHARSGEGPVYLAMRAASGDARSCDRCHSSLDGLIEAENPAVLEGVTCDVCHTIPDVVVEGPTAKFELRVRENIKYGPMCDVKDHYFHKMGCSPTHEESTICAACHHHSLPNGIGVFTEFAEWRASAYAAPHIECQDCHMPGDMVEVAVGSATRAEVPHHGFLGRDGGLRKRALSLTMTVDEKGGQLTAEVALENHGGGHHVPTGLPGRQIVLRVRALGGDGAELERSEKIYSRVLVDASGTEVPFYAASSLGSDNRIAAKETRREEFRIAAAETRELRAELSWRLSPALTARVGQPPVAEEPLAEARAMIAARGPGGRAGLPKTVAVKP